MPNWPMRFTGDPSSLRQKRIGPLESILIRSEMMAIGMAKRIRPTVAPKMSKARLMMRCQPSNGVAFSLINGMPPGVSISMLVRWTSRVEGTKLYWMWFTWQKSTM